MRDELNELACLPLLRGDEASSTLKLEELWVNRERSSLKSKRSGYSLCGLHAPPAKGPPVPSVVAGARHSFVRPLLSCRFQLLDPCL
jgi:hypothetical protein